MKASSSIRFGPFEFNPQICELRKFGLKVKLTPQAGKVLALLLENPARTRTREEICQQLWPTNTFVDFEHSLNKTIHALRQALGDSASSPRYIETLPGQGYRCLANAQESMHRSTKRRAVDEVESIAVLPFGSEYDEPYVPFLEQQIALRLINTLSTRSKLRVLGYTTVKHYKAAVANPQEIGRDLGVQAVLAGEIVRCNNEDALIYVELIDVTDGAQLWGMQLKQNWAKLSERGEQVAEEISQQLTPSLGPSTKAGRPHDQQRDASLAVLLKQAWQDAG